jgi:DNA-binding LacI/PurR family transcriptional regulator
MTPKTVDKQNPIPRYLQVRNILEDSIRTGQYKPGSRLPGERDLAIDFNVSQMTVNKAILALVNDGWLRREIGNGTFVSESLRIPAPSSLKIGFAVPFSPTFAEEDYYLGSLLRGIQKAILNEPVSLSVLETPPHALYDRIMECGADGCILVDLLDDNLEDVRRLAESGKRTVILGADQDPLHIPYVDSDNVGGTKEAIEHLFSLGHRRIAGLFAYMGRSNTLRRLDAYREAMAEHGLVIPDGYVLDLGNENVPDVAIQEALLKLLKSSEPVTAIFCGGFYIALEVISFIRSAGFSVPEDVSIVGFDDPLPARYMSPALSTVRQPLEEMGHCAMSKLMEWLLGGIEPQLRSVLPTSLVVRGSTAPVPAPGLEITVSR